MFSDECSAEQGAGKSVEWCFGCPKDKWKPQFVKTYKKGRDISVMVWGCFWSGKEGGRSDLYIMDRDFESKKHGYSANSYLEVLEDQLPKCWMPGLIFVHDNAPIHTANAVKKWFEEMDIPFTDWPPYSPDLNPIENAWALLKKKVLEMHPELEHVTGKSEEDIQELERALIEAWEALPDSLFENLVKSMPKRVKACYRAKGWHTKY